MAKGDRVTRGGVIYEDNGDGTASVVGYEGAQSTPTRTELPRTTSEIAQDRRDDAAAGRDDVRTGIAVRGEGRDIARSAFEKAAKLRDDYNANPEVKAYRNAIATYSSAIKTDNTPQGDLSLIYSFAKIMDPGSVVREGEAAAVASSDTIAGQIEARLKKELGTGGTFSPEARNNLLREMQTRVLSYKQQYDNQRDWYSRNANAYGVTPDVVVGPRDDTRVYEEAKKYWEDRGVQVLPSAKDERGNPLPDGARVMPGDYRSSMVGQTMSGLNEGIAGTLGAPVDLLTMGLNLVPQGVNAATNSNLPQIKKPVGGSEWLRDVMGDWGIYGQTDDKGKMFARRTAQSVGAAVPLTGMMGTGANVARSLTAAAGGGVGAATAQQVAPGNVPVEMLAELVGSGGTAAGLFGARRKMAQNAIESEIPTVQQLKDQAGVKYREAESRGVTATPEMTTQLSVNMRQKLIDDGKVSPEGRINETYPKAKEAIQLIDDYAGKPMNVKQMQTARSIIAEGMTSVDPNERRIASKLLDEFDSWASPQAPELASAREISSRYLNAQKLEQARELAEADASQFTGSGIENAMRRRYRELDRKTIKGQERFTQPLADQIEVVSRGTTAGNVARDLGKWAPTGVVSTGMGGGLGYLAGSALGGPLVGAAAGAGVAGIGAGARGAATAITNRQAQIAELMARNGRPIPQAPFIDAETQKAVTALLASQTSAKPEPEGMFGSRRKKKDRKER